MNDGSPTGNSNESVAGKTAGVMAASVAPRENMITTAITFLLNPKVRESTMVQRKSFLQKKGLTAEEIEIAIQRSGTAMDEYKQPVVQQMAGPPVVQQVEAPVSTWSKARDHMATAIVVGGVVYAVYKFYKRFLEPMWFGPSREEVALTAIQKSVEDMQTNLQDTLQIIQSVQTSLTKQQENVEDIVRNSSNQRGSLESLQMQERTNVEEVKDEIKSLKGLLLNRKQFPSMPASSPVIPSWQLTPRADSPTSAAQPTVTMTTSTSQPDLSNSVVKGTSGGQLDLPNGVVNGVVKEIGDNQPDIASVVSPEMSAHQSEACSSNAADSGYKSTNTASTKINKEVMMNGDGTLPDAELAPETDSSASKDKTNEGSTVEPAPIGT